MFIGVTSTSKTQIDQLGDRLRKGGVSDEDIHLLESYRSSFEEAYEEVVTCIRNAVQLEPTGRRAKSTSSIIEKLRRETMRPSQMQDIAGCRLVVRDVLVQNKVVEQIRSRVAKAVVVDRRKQPSYGYRAVHIIATARNRSIEIQVRTELQHLWAQLSEKLSDALDPGLKYGGGDPQVRKRLSKISEVIGSFEELETGPVAAQLAGRVGRLKQEIREILENATAF